MTDISRQTPAAAPRNLVLPALLLAALAVAGVLTFGGPGQNDSAYAPLEGDAIDGVEFLTLGPDALPQALDAACAVTGCDAGDLHPMITASAIAMTVEELTDALAAQARILDESSVARDAATADSAAGRVALLELAAAARIADLYRTELRSR